MKNYNEKFPEPLHIDIGCGPWKKAGFIGIDNYIGEEQWNVKGGQPIDINHDLSKGIPFNDSTVEEIFASHFMEHTDLDFMLKEVHRVAIPNAIFQFIVPYANSAEGMFPGHNVFLTEKFFQQNTLFNQLFKDAMFEYTPSDEWESGELKKYIDMPFDIARVHFFNVCKWFTITCKIKK
jgi:predicted SAM-dependent methyltransferase